MPREENKTQKDNHAMEESALAGAAADIGVTYALDAAGAEVGGALGAAMGGPAGALVGAAAGLVAGRAYYNWKTS